MKQIVAPRRITHEHLSTVQLLLNIHNRLDMSTPCIVLDFAPTYLLAAFNALEIRESIVTYLIF